MSENQNIRWAEPKDAAHMVRPIQALAAYENEPAHSVKVTEADIRRDGVCKPETSARRFECLIAEHGSRPVGLCLFFHNYSTWEGCAGIYVEDLFVEEQARSLGLGRAIMGNLSRIAQERNCNRIDLSVLEWNPNTGVLSSNQVDPHERMAVLSHGESRHRRARQDGGGHRW